MQTNDHIFIERISYPITNLGPGNRIGIWVQGCSRNCPGCMSPHSKIQRPEYLHTIDSIAEIIIPIADNFDGVTISGGEPFEQAGALTKLLGRIRRQTKLDILVYSGYSLEEIRNGLVAMKRLLNQIDILIDGPFIEHLPNTKLWRGSDNQGMHLLTSKVQKYQPFVKATYNGKRQLKIEMKSNDELWLTGIPERDFFHKFEQQAKHRGLILNYVEE